MNELPEEIELPPMDYGLAAHEQCDVREAQLKSSLAANQYLGEKVANAQALEILAQAKCNELEAANREQKAEIERLLKNSFWGQYKVARENLERTKAELASLRASAGEKWIDVKQELPPVGVWVLGWLFLPKNPPASGCSIAQYTGCKRDEPESFGRVRMTVDCWWANGIYYSSGHFTHWKPLPAPPTLPGEGVRR